MPRSCSRDWRICAPELPPALPLSVGSARCPRTGAQKVAQLLPALDCDYCLGFVVFTSQISPSLEEPWWAQSLSLAPWRPTHFQGSGVALSLRGLSGHEGQLSFKPPSNQTVHPVFSGADTQSEHTRISPIPGFNQEVKQRAAEE